MAELAEIISSETEKPISKSCINHRFRKIKEIIENIGGQIILSMIPQFNASSEFKK